MINSFNKIHIHSILGNWASGQLSRAILANVIWVFLGVTAMMDDRDKKIEETGNLLKNASNMLLSISRNSHNPNNDIANTLVRARTMMDSSSSSQLYQRLNRSERLRACSGGSSAVSTGKSGKKGKSASDEQRDHDFALLKSISDSDDEDEEAVASHLKKESIIERGIIILDGAEMEKDIREKLVSTLNAKYPIIGKNDLEFVKVTQKKITIMQLGRGLEYNYKVLKKLIGQGSLYVRMKAGYQFVLEPNQAGEEISPPASPRCL